MPLNLFSNKLSFKREYKFMSILALFYCKLGNTGINYFEVVDGYFFWKLVY